MTNHPDWNVIAVNNHRFLGIIPTFLDLDDPRDAKTQLNEAYAHGGGWQKFNGFTLLNVNGDGTQKPIPDWKLWYPDDPPYSPVGWCYLRDECVIVWPYSWVMVWKSLPGTLASGEWEVCRMD